MAAWTVAKLAGVALARLGGGGGGRWRWWLLAAVAAGGLPGALPRRGVAVALAGVALALLEAVALARLLTAARTFQKVFL